MAAKFDIAGLIHATELSFQILQPFYENKPSSLRFKQIRELTDAYIRAIDHSLHCSDRGIDICRDVLVLHDFMEEEKSREYLEPFLDEVQAKAKEAHADARLMADEFAAVQEGLREMCDDMSQPEPKQKFASQKSWKHKIADLASQLKALLPDDNGLSIGTTVAGMLAGAHPLLLIIIPLVISLAMLAFRAAAYFIEKRKLKVDASENALQNLQEPVSKFVEWWSDMEGEIVAIREAYLQAGRKEAMALLLKPSWEDLQRLYTIYNDQIRKIRDSYPKCRIEKPAEPTSDRKHQVELPLSFGRKGVHGLVQVRWLGQQR